MSFSQQVKTELSAGVGKKHFSIIACGLLYGLSAANTNAFPPFSKTTADLVSALLSSHTCTIKQISKGYRITLDIISPLPARLPAELQSSGDLVTGFFLRGLFLSCGTITNPEKQYHCELSLPQTEYCDSILNLMSEHGLFFKKSVRKERCFLYAKDSEHISDFLTFIGATKSSLEIMNAKILKDVRNNVNRVVNFETANLEKTTDAAIQQVQDIEYIFERKGKAYLSEDLLSVARLRLENRELSLREIGELLEPKISRSGVNHRFKKIAEIAESLRNNED